MQIQRKALTLYGLNSTDKHTILDYHYPAFVLKFPVLMRAVYWANYLTQLRKWYVMKTWKKLLKESGTHASIIDFGAGEAQYLVPFCKTYPTKTFTATDNRKSNINLVKSFAYQNLSGALIDIEKESFQANADLGICIGVMQYLEKDEQALSNMYKSLKEHAGLLLYVPINGKIITGFYQRVFSKYEQYESINARKRVYTEQEITQKLIKNGFTIIEKTYTYGVFGKLSHELLNTWSTLIFSATIPLKIIAAFGLLISFPIILLLMLTDFWSSKKDGNGLLLYVKK